jgi:hypothetical protein
VKAHFADTHGARQAAAEKEVVQLRAHTETLARSKSLLHRTMMEQVGLSSPSGSPMLLHSQDPLGSRTPRHASVLCAGCSDAGAAGGWEGHAA